MKSWSDGMFELRPNIHLLALGTSYTDFEARVLHRGTRHTASIASGDKNFIAGPGVKLVGAGR
jgi:hypothetical protein